MATEVQNYVDNKNKQVVLSIRGTDFIQSLKDIYYDFKIVIGEELETSYYKNAYKLLKKIIKKYKGYKITLCGFSLGGRIVINLLDIDVDPLKPLVADNENGEDVTYESLSSALISKDLSHWLK